jgi:hypothetical protein
MRIFFGGLALALWLATAPAAAQTKPAEAKVGLVAPGAATSLCIGSATSPVCMAETLLACFARAEAGLCAKVGADPHAGRREPGLIEYVIERVNVIRAEDVTEDMRDVDWFKAGYTLVELRRRNCPAAAGCAGEPWDDLQVYLRPRGSAWEMVAWRGESEPEGAPEIPDAYRPQAQPQ